MIEVEWIATEWVVYCPNCGEPTWDCFGEEKIIKCGCSCTFVVK